MLKAKGSYPMTAVAADFDNDGWPDIYVACDSTASFMLRNNHDGTFTDIGLETGVALNEDGMEQARGASKARSGEARRRLSAIGRNRNQFRRGVSTPATMALDDGR